MTRVRHTIEQGLFVREYGDPAAPALVWLHGLGESALGFEAIVQHPGLARWRHVVPDLPGYGRTAWPSTPLTFHAVADLVDAWLEGRGAGRAVVLGHSLGGVFGVHLAERHPSRVRAFVNIEGNLTGGDCTFSRLAAQMPRDAFVATGFARLREQILDEDPSNPALRGYYAGLRQADPATYHAHAEELVAESETCTLPARLAALPHPLLYVAGVPGGVTPRSLGALAELRVRHVRLQPSGHWPFTDQPQTFAAAVGGFLSELGGRPT